MSTWWKKLIESWGRRPELVTAKVEIYTWQTCPYCIRAKLLLMWTGVQFTEYKIDGDGLARIKMAERAVGRRTVPQIFVNHQHVGGCDDLYKLDRDGKLDALLAKSPAALESHEFLSSGLEKSPFFAPTANLCTQTVIENRNPVPIFQESS